MWSYTSSTFGSPSSTCDVHLIWPSVWPSRIGCIVPEIATHSHTHTHTHTHTPYVVDKIHDSPNNRRINRKTHMDE